ncbi:MAG TPA: DciA family protein [Candidatus Limnocylindrales bacterium]|nr:DciA family protein [Candidatus Limnocylindrales bacterium]
MTPPRKRPLQRVADLLPSLAAELGLQEELQAARAMSSWRRVVEELVPAAAGATRLIEIRPPALFVSADDAATGQELRLHSAPLLDAFAGAPGGQRLLELKVVVRAPRR